MSARPMSAVERRVMLSSCRDMLGQIVGKFGPVNPIAELAGELVGVIERYEATCVVMESKVAP